MNELMKNVIHVHFIKCTNMLRNSRPDMLCKKGVLGNFAKVHRQTPVPESRTRLLN